MPQQLNQGLVSIFTGDGKGKSTAAIGTVVRAAGHGLRSIVISFMKGKGYIHGENNILAQLPSVTLMSFGQKGWIDKDNITAENRRQAKLALAAAAEAIASGSYDLVVLDEINVAIDYGLIEPVEVVKLIKNRPGSVEIILTGRNADPRLIQMADLVTEMRMVKHPYTQGIKARRGIDY